MYGLGQTVGGSILGGAAAAMAQQGAAAQGAHWMSIAQFAGRAAGSGGLRGAVTGSSPNYTAGLHHLADTIDVREIAMKYLALPANRHLAGLRAIQQYALQHAGGTPATPGVMLATSVRPGQAAGASSQSSPDFQRGYLVGYATAMRAVAQRAAAQQHATAAPAVLPRTPPSMSGFGSYTADDYDNIYED